MDQIRDTENVFVLAYPQPVTEVKLTKTKYGSVPQKSIENYKNAK